MLWMLWMPHSRAHFVCQNDFWANICANVLRNPYPATGRYVPVQFSKFYHWKYSCEVFLLCMMMMIGQMMKLRKQAWSIWQRGALEWWSGASALSADGYWTNTILSGSPSWFLPSGFTLFKVDQHHIVRMVLECERSDGMELWVQPACDKWK